MLNPARPCVKKKSDLSYDIVAMPGKGKGLIATRKISWVVLWIGNFDQFEFSIKICVPEPDKFKRIVHHEEQRGEAKERTSRTA